MSVANENGDALVFSRSNGNLSKTGYLAASSLEWDLYMVNTQGTVYRVGPVKIDNVEPRQHYHFRFALDEQTRSQAMSGAGLLRVLVDDSVNEKYYELNLDFTGEGLPSISGQDFDLADGIAVKKGDNSSHNVVNFSAPRGIKSLTLSHSDAKLLDAGLPQLVQLVDASSATVQNLSALGLGVSALSYGQTETSVDFGPFLGTLPMGDYYLSMDLIDVRNRYSAATVVLSVTSPVEADATSAKPWAEFAILNGRWYTEERPSGLRFQWKKAGDSEWTDYTGSVSYNDAAATFSAEFYGLQAATDYVFRVKTDKEEENREVNFKTSPAGTIPNLNFDDWYQDGSAWYAASNSSTRVWDSANKAERPASARFLPRRKIRAWCMERPPAWKAPGDGGGNHQVCRRQHLYRRLCEGLRRGCGAGLGHALLLPSAGPARLLQVQPQDYRFCRNQPLRRVKKGEMDACSIKMYLCDWSAKFRVNTSKQDFPAGRRPFHHRHVRLHLQRGHQWLCGIHLPAAVP